MLKAYVFDFEGTLVDFQWDLEAGVEAAKARLEELGFGKEKVLKWDSYNKLYNEATIETLMGKVDLSPSEIREKIGEVFDFWDLDAATRWQLRDGAQDTLNRLRRKATVGLFTTVGRKAVMKVLQKYEIDKLFHIMVTRNEVTLLKPSDEGLRLILNVIGISPEEMLFIGDSDRDIAAAKGIGARSAFIVGGEQELSPEIKPDHVIHSLSDLLSIE